MSQPSCFLEMLVQERSRMRGCRLMMPVSAWGVMVRLMLKSILDHNRLSRHLMTNARVSVSIYKYIISISI